ncbi:helix-turn-helix transcriptional regulator [Microbacterium sp. 179-I 3D3 NHS]|uniref:helix-turn-helix transcriptional regulator n=1 Tax=Microbacterium sp. 179-I 3D3 NHS TaxID=3142382 RepID=UPI00399FCF7A
MESPSSRTLHLLSLLQTGGEWSVPDLAERLDASARTVRRDAQRLRDLGYDVRSRPGPGAAYRLHPGTKIPPLLLDADEVATIITGLLVLETWTPGDPAASVARTKLEQVLSPTLRRRAAATALSTQILQGDPAPVDFALVGTLADAVAAGARVALAYTDQHGRETQRTVEPYRHFLRDGHWYVVAYDIDRDDWRLFRLDRMRSARALAGVHAGREFPFASIESWLTSDFGRRV